MVLAVSMMWGTSRTLSGSSCSLYCTKRRPGIIILRLRWRRASLSIFTRHFFSFLHEESVLVDVVTIQLLSDFPTS